MGWIFQAGEPVQSQILRCTNQSESPDVEPSNSQNSLSFHYPLRPWSDPVSLCFGPICLNMRHVHSKKNTSKPPNQISFSLFLRLSRGKPLNYTMNKKKPIWLCFRLDSVTLFKFWIIGWTLVVAALGLKQKHSASIGRLGPYKEEFEAGFLKQKPIISSFIQRY